MASHAALAVRRAQAMNRLSAAVEKVTASFNLESPDPIHPAALRDPQIADVARLEQVADLLEGIQENKPVDHSREIDTLTKERDDLKKQVEVLSKPSAPKEPAKK